MDFQGPKAADLANVYALNLGFFKLLRTHAGLLTGANTAAASVVAKLAALPNARADRVAQCPFLMFALAAAEDRRWTTLFDDNEQPDLLDEMHRPPDAVALLTAATLGFLWELARRNPYATRLVSGASLGWCEQLADSAPLRLFQFAARQSNLLAPRLATQSFFWEKLIGAGSSHEADIRRSAHLCALQTVLTRSPNKRYRALRAAACRMPAPTLRVADHGRRSPGN